MNTKKIIDYLSCDEDYTWRFPPQLMYLFAFVFILVTTIIAIVDPKGKDEVKHLDMSIEMDSTRVDSVYKAEEVILETDSVFKVPKGHYWSSQETKLPIGIVHKMDFAHGDKPNKDNLSNNYVTVKGRNGKLTIIKDIDDDLFLNMEVGDTIR